VRIPAAMIGMQMGAEDVIDVFRPDPGGGEIS
jgi:hypothetical protein